jgi:hypothetical protein
MPPVPSLWIISYLPNFIGGNILSQNKLALNLKMLCYSRETALNSDMEDFMKKYPLFIVLVLITCCSGSSKSETDNQTQDSNITDAVSEITDSATDQTQKDTAVTDTQQTDIGDWICDPYKQTGCELDEGICIFDENDTPMCTVKGEVPLGGGCSSVDICMEGACIDLGGAGTKCYKYCKPKAGVTYHPDCKIEGKARVCLQITGKQWGLCQLPPSSFETCNLLQQNCKNANSGCTFSNLTWEHICMKAGMFKDGEACSQESDCAKGFICDGNACRQLCNMDTAQEPKCTKTEYQCKLYYGKQNAGLCKE